MEIRFKPRTLSLDPRCFMCTEQPVTGVRLKAGYLKPGRPEVVKTILLVDDNSDFLKTARLILDEYAVKVVAVDPTLLIREQVFKLVNEHKPDLVVMDGLMPDVLGVELIKELRQNIGYHGYIAANSSSGKQTSRMMQEGADFSILDKNIYDLLNHFDA